MQQDQSSELPDSTPQRISTGVINPYALAEALTGKTFDWSLPESAKTLSDILETPYEELFDIKFGSPLYAGLKLNPTTKEAEPLDASELKILSPADRLTPALNKIGKLADLKGVGVTNLDALKVNAASVEKGRLNLVLPAPPILNRKITNISVTKELSDLVIPKPTSGTSIGWTPIGGTWTDMGDFFKDVTEFNDPIQGAVANCYLIAALAAIAWADPYSIIHRNRATGATDVDFVNAIQFYSKGGSHNAPSSLVEVTDKTIVDSTRKPIYCRSRDSGEIWPALYEKAFAKWSTRNTTDSPDITQTAYGDTVLAIAKITDKTAYYYSTSSRTPDTLMSILRANSANFKTVFPMTAWTAWTGPDFTGTNIVGGHAYTVLGWARQGGKDYIVLRNPWGQTEPSGLNTIQGIVSFFDQSFWRPINTIPNDGVFALEIGAFKTYYQGFGVAK